MTNQHTYGGLTQTEIEALASKVEDWSRGLTWQERAFMAEVVVRAASAEPADVRGYGMETSTTPQPFLPADMIALNFTKIQWPPNGNTQ